ncbi:MAG: hypothetical protein AB7I13_00415 [Vicinamibacterales bacterium]
MHALLVAYSYSGMAADEAIGLALTPEEWEGVARHLERVRESADQASGFSAQAGVDSTRLTDVIESIRRGRPLGFTWADVDVIRNGADYYDWDDGARQLKDQMLAVANRIAAFLPPESQTQPTLNEGAAADLARAALALQNRRGYRDGIVMATFRRGKSVEMVSVYICGDHPEGADFARVGSPLRTDCCIICGKPRPT